LHEFWAARVFSFPKKRASQGLTVLQNYHNRIKMTSNTFSIVVFGKGSECLFKIHSNTQCHNLQLMTPVMVPMWEGQTAS
jgi:hypothetical protein